MQRVMQRLTSGVEMKRKKVMYIESNCSVSLLPLLLLLASDLPLSVCIVLQRTDATCS